MPMDHLIVARVRRPHGVAGEVLVAVDTDRPQQVFTRGRTLLLGDERGEPVGKQVTLQRIRPTTGAAILKLEGITDRDQADALRGHTILIDAESAAPPAGDEVHYRHLIGLRGTSDGAAVGQVVDLLELPTGQLLVLRSIEGKEILVPLVKELLEAVDLEAGEVRLKLPDGFLEI